MQQTGAGGVVRLIQTLWDAGTVASMDDAELLGRSLGRDAIAEAAFAALVRRHAPMVLRVCRNVTGDPHNAEDAAQATFLVLARSARSVRRGDSIANWLFGTARRIAARAVRDAARRRRHERRYAESVAGHRASEDTVGSDREWAGLYEELGRLPDRYRAPIVLCDLEGLTHEQAAVSLGCPSRTLQTRLYRGRERLRARLVRRGLLPAVGLVGCSFTAEAASAAVPIPWANATTAIAMRMATGRAVVIEVAEAVNLLIRGENRAMFLSSLRWIATSLVIIGLSAGLTFGLSPRQRPDRPGKTTESRSDTKSVTRSAQPAQPAPMTTPITVRGRATDGEGKPVAGATIHLVSTSSTDALLGTTTTDRDGSYTFRNARLPVDRGRDDSPLAGTFQVYGTAPGRGFAWHGMRSYQPRRQPAEWKTAGETYILFGGEPMVMDLRFTPAATLSGRIIDEAGRPVPDARISLGHCDFLDTKGKETHHNFREFWAINTAPAAPTKTKTGPDGRFRLEGLPREAGFRVIVEHPDHAWTDLYAATTDRPTTAFDYPSQSVLHERPPVATGEFTFTLRSTRQIAVRTVFADSGRPAPKVRVSVWRGTAGPNGNGITDADGKLLLRIPPGQYEFLADPTPAGAACVRTMSTFKVDEQPVNQSLEVRVKPGCVLILQVVDARTGQGIPGVTFLRDVDGQPGSRISVQSRSGFIDNPRSEANGCLRAVVDPGERAYAVGYIPESAGYRRPASEKRVRLSAGGTVTVRFELEK
jgi:RNA polymerase sigma factor (sigma-70 family)